MYAYTVLEWLRFCSAMLRVEAMIYKVYVQNYMDSTELCENFNPRNTNTGEIQLYMCVFSLRLPDSSTGFLDSDAK